MVCGIVGVTTKRIAVLSIHNVCRREKVPRAVDEKVVASSFSQKSYLIKRSLHYQESRYNIHNIKGVGYNTKNAA